MTNKSYDEFLEELADYESNKRWDVENEFGFLGAFQMGEEALEDAGYYKRNKKLLMKGLIQENL